ncbi:MAG TPA: metallophosphoesterase [Streptosporangiaceae bacterium]|jgi:3',5'-cyclic AMP phosphodiesterase CpdA
MAISDLHVGYQQNREFAEGLRPASDDDWLIVAGDVGEFFADIASLLATLAKRFATVVWAPGNHELWTHRRDPVQLRGEQRYLELVRVCRELGVHTPEDPYPVWRGAAGPVTVAPLFTLYDYTFWPDGAQSQQQALEMAFQRGIVCTDEYLLHPDPYPSREEWCAARLSYTERRLAACTHPLVLVSHYPLVREPTRVLRYPEFAQWCGSVHTADWHIRHDVVAVVYGHLHIPRSTVHDGVPFEEVSVGYPREWGRRGGPRGPRQILPAVS